MSNLDAKQEVSQIKSAKLRAIGSHLLRRPSRRAREYAASVALPSVECFRGPESPSLVLEQFAYPEPHGAWEPHAWWMAHSPRPGFGLPSNQFATSARRKPPRKSLPLEFWAWCLAHAYGCAVPVTEHPAPRAAWPSRDIELPAAPRFFPKSS